MSRSRGFVPAGRGDLAGHAVVPQAEGSIPAGREDPRVEELLQLVVRLPTGGKQMHDANPGESTLSPLVATMLVHDVTRLFASNVARGARRTKPTSAASTPRSSSSP